MLRRHTPLALAGALALAACGGPPQAPVAATPQSDPGVVAVGHYELRYGTVATSDLPRELAADYGVSRRDGVLLLTVSVLRREADLLPVPVEASVTGSQRNLVGDPAALAFRRLRGGGPSWIAEVDPTAGGIVLIDIEAQPAGGGPRLAASLKRDFPAR